MPFIPKLNGVAMTSYIILCVIFALSVSSVNGKTNTDLTRNVPEMTDREMMEVLMTRVSRLETDNIKQETRIDILEDIVFKQNEVIKSMQKVLDGKGFDEDIAAETNDIDTYEHEASDDQTKKQQPKRENLSRNTSRKLNMGRARRQLPGTPVAFSSLLTHNIDHIGAHQDIVFDKTYVNTNTVYNPNHGVFTVPVSGVYVITASVLANQNREVWAEMVVNGALKAYIYARGTDNRHDQGTQTILLHLKQGDDVAIRNYEVDDSIYGGLYTTFSGFLLFEEESIAIVG